MSTAAGAQPLQPLPPLPPAGEPPPPPAPPAPPPPPRPAPPLAPAEPVAPPPVQYQYVPPPPGPPELSLASVPHAPRYSLWLGGRLGVLAYGGTLYDTETTGNFVGNGLAVEVDVGARIERRYIPYLALELGLVPPGHRFQGTQATAGTSFVGVGVRLLAGDVDNVSFASEISFGFRRLQVSRGDTNETWSATGFEFLRIGLGADIRLSSKFTLTPMLTVSGGTLTDTSGSVTYAAGQGDGQTGTPTYVNSSQIPGNHQSNYEAFMIGCGAHFDLLGK